MSDKFLGFFFCGCVFNISFFKISSAKFTGEISINNHSTQNNVQFCGCLIKIIQMLSICQTFEHSL